MPSPLSGIQTNIVTGFLGVGKSTAILNFLRQKPEGERWAVLVNEFGEVGIDGGLIGSREDSQNDIFIREVPGGCMCCAAGLPMQMAMNMLLARARPDRLLIEPTGLGHPIEVVQVLSSEHYQKLLDLRATITLIDARKISDSRYTDHSTFNQQIEIADVIVASKSDLYRDGEVERLEDYLKEKGWAAGKQVVTASGGIVSPRWLTSPSQASHLVGHLEHQDNNSHEAEEPTLPSFPPEGFVRLSNQGDGYVSHGWVFQSDRLFDLDALRTLLGHIEADRIKALFKTNKGNVGFNVAGDGVEEVSLGDIEDSRLEIIAAGEFPAADLETQLLSAVLHQ